MSGLNHEDMREIAEATGNAELLMEVTLGCAEQIGYQPFESVADIDGKVGDVLYVGIPSSMHLTDEIQDLLEIHLDDLESIHCADKPKKASAKKISTC